MNFTTNFGIECGVGVARSTLNTPRKQRARGGHKREIVEAGDGLYARKRFAKHEFILDYTYMNGVNGEKVDRLTRAERWQRYPARPGNPEGVGKYLLEVGNGAFYLDALQQNGARGEGRCGLGGKANTNPGGQNAQFKGSKIRATRAIRMGEEIFVPYRRCYKLKDIMVDKARSGWCVIGKRFFRDSG